MRKTAENQRETTLPEGFMYEEDFLTEEEERGLVEIFSTLQFQTFEYKGYPATRQVLAYGWTYDFTTNELSGGIAIPDFLLPVREKAAVFAEVAPEEFEEVLLTEYPPGAQINWHRDLPMFDKVVGVSLLNSCTFRLRSYKKGAKPIVLTLPPRSVYLMKGAARWSYRHNIPPVEALRYSITLRTMKKRANGNR